MSAYLYVAFGHLSEEEQPEDTPHFTLPNGKKVYKDAFALNYQDWYTSLSEPKIHLAGFGKTRRGLMAPMFDTEEHNKRFLALQEWVQGYSHVKDNTDATHPLYGTCDFSLPTLYTREEIMNFPYMNAPMIRTDYEGTGYEPCDDGDNFLDYLGKDYDELLTTIRRIRPDFIVFGLT